MNAKPKSAIGYQLNEWHDYYCNRDDANTLIAWLMDRGYWFEFDKHERQFHVRCACGPKDLPKSLRAAQAA